MTCLNTFEIVVLILGPVILLGLPVSIIALCLGMELYDAVKRLAHRWTHE